MPGEDDSVDDGPVELEVDTDSEHLRKSNLQQFLDLHEETMRFLRAMQTARDERTREKAREHLLGAVVAELIFVEPALRQSDYWSSPNLGAITYEPEKGETQHYVFAGLSSIINNRDGVDLETYSERDTPGDSRSTKELRKVSYDIPTNALVAAVRVLHEWMDDVGLAVQFAEHEDDAELDYSAL
jgi:hypothetical protein